MRDLNQYYWKYDDFRQKIRGMRIGNSIPLICYYTCVELQRRKV